MRSSGTTKNKMLGVGNGGSQNEGMIVKNFQSRERKKSKYLSPPYTNLSFRRKNMLVSKDPSETEDPVASKVTCDGLDMNDTAGLDSQSLLESDAMKTKKWSGRLINSFNVQEIANASSAKLLAELHYAALDCLYPSEDGYFMSIKRFFSMFRSSVFCDGSIAVLATEDGSQGMNAQAIRHLPAAGNSEQKKSKMKTMETLTSSMDNELTGDLSNGFFPSHKSKYNRKMITRKEEKSSVGMTSVLTGTLFDVATSSLYPDNFLGKSPLMPDLNRTTDLAGSVIEVTEINWEDNKDSSFDPHNVNRISARHCSFVNDPLEMCFFSLENKVRKKNTKGNAKSGHPQPMHTGGMLDLNTNGAEFGSFGLGMNFHCPIPRKTRRRRKRTDPNQVEVHGEARGTALLMAFAPVSAMPSKEAMITTFCEYGPLKESETLVMVDSGSARVVFERSSDAGEAFWSLGKSRPFGSALINYRLHNHSGASRTLKLDSNLHVPLVVQRPKVLVVPVKPPTLNHQVGDQTPSLFLIRQNLEMMASMLEKSGDDMSSVTRAKLETEIQQLLKKVRTMDAGSSS